MTIDEEYGPMGDEADFESISQQLAIATTRGEVEAIQKTCPHPSFDYDFTSGFHACRLCGKQIGEAEYFDIDDIPF